jgi:hypothetical protein
MDAGPRRRVAFSVPRRRPRCNARRLFRPSYSGLLEATSTSSRAGIFARFAPEATLRVFEPSLAGKQVAVIRDAVFEAGAGAVVKIAGTVARSSKAAAKRATGSPNSRPNARRSTRSPGCSTEDRRSADPCPRRRLFARMLRAPVRAYGYLVEAIKREDRLPSRDRPAESSGERSDPRRPGSASSRSRSGAVSVGRATDRGATSTSTVVSECSATCDDEDPRSPYLDDPRRRRSRRLDPRRP